MHITHQERLLILALIVALLIGSGIGLFRRNRGISLEHVHRPDPSLQEEREEPQEMVVVVHVTGAVQKSGVYVLPQGARVLDAVEAAGGLDSDSDPDRVNLAAYLGDGQQIFIPYRVNQPDSEYPEKVTNPGLDPMGKVRINSASQSELELLPGIGPVLAERIVAYRNQHGDFQRLEDLLGVSGIGAKKLADIKEMITLH